MKCPKCGYKRQLRDDAYVPRNECPSCGIVYSKKSFGPLGGQGLSAQPILGHKSPVHESSLQQARERVEKKLRKQLESRLKDERHQQTLARAKKIAASEVRKRKAEWERNHRPSTVESDQTANESMVETNTHAHSAQTTSENFQEPLSMRNAALAQASAEDTLAETLEDDSITAELTANDTWPTARQRQHVDTRTRHPKPQMMPTGIKREKPDTKMATGVASPSPENDNASNPPTHETHPEPELTGHHSTTIPEDAGDQLTQAAMAHALHQRAQNALSTGLMRVLPMVAWLILTAGIIGAVLSWTTIKDVEASVGSASIPMSQGALPIGLLLGFAYLATGVLGFAFFWATSMISRQLKDIRLLLLVQPRAQSQD